MRVSREGEGVVVVVVVESERERRIKFIPQTPNET
jgi:hypothetical protein